MLETITLKQGEVEVDVVPARGALVSGLRVSGTDVLYLDRGTLDDTTKNVRGGIPLLFPFAGKLDGGRFLAAGTEMKQHGFGRNKAWEIVSRGASQLRVALEPDAETHAVYPYLFSTDHTVALLPRGVQIELLVHNRDSRPLPVSPGWHPYFACDAEQKALVTGDAKGLAETVHGDSAEFDFGVPAPVAGRGRFLIPGLGVMSLSFSPEMRHLQFWSQPGKNFICIEPFFGPNNTINTTRRREIPPGAAHLFFMRIEMGE